jgi:NAD(P)H dehydrogenase (quinone)
MILVTGAAGKTGKAVVEALAKKGAPVRAMVHRIAHIAALRTLGAAECVVASFENATALRRAAEGANAIYHICPNVSPHEVAYAHAVVEAAEANGVTRFVYHSVLHPQIEAMPHHWQKMRAEEMLFAADLDLTILQPTAYMQNILAAFPGIIAEGVFRIPYPVTTRLSLVDLQDVAEAAALVLTADGHSGATYELVGAETPSQTEVAAAIAKAFHRTMRAEAETAEAWQTRAREAGMGEYECATLAAMFRYYADHGLIGNSRVLASLLGRKPTDLAAFSHRSAARGEP